VIVNTGGRDIGVAEPFLDLCNVGLVVECIGDGRRAQRMGPDLKNRAVLNTSHQPVNPVGCERFLEAARSVVADRPKEGAVSSAPWPAASR